MVLDRAPPAHPPTEPRLRTEGLIESVTVDIELNAAETDWLEFIVTLHVPVPEQAPDQPAKDDALAGVAVTPTLSPAGKEVPVGKVVMDPLPLPVVEVERV